MLSLCVSVCVSAYLYISVCLCVSLCLCVPACVCVSVFVFVSCVVVCLSEGLYVSVRLCVCLCLSMSLCANCVNYMHLHELYKFRVLHYYINHVNKSYYVNSIEWDHATTQLPKDVRASLPHQSLWFPPTLWLYIYIYIYVCVYTDGGFFEATLIFVQFLEIFGSSLISFWCFQIVLMALAVWARFFKSGWRRNHAKIWSGDDFWTFCDAIICATLCFAYKLPFYNELFKTASMTAHRSAP